MNAHPFPSSTTHSSKPLELIHTDLHGPFKTSTIGGYHYWVTFINDCTRFQCLIFLKSKSETFTAFKQYKAYAENHLDVKIKCLRNDKGGEYISKEFKEFLFEHGLTSQYTVHARPQQNGVAERANRTIQEHVVAMLEESHLPPLFLGEAVTAYIHVWNRCPTTSLTSKTPYELWHQKKADVSHLRVWGCTAYVHIQKDKRTASGSHMEKCVIIGYPDGYKGWKFYNPITKRVVISEHAECDEQYFPGLKHTPLTPEPFEPLEPIIPLIFTPTLDSGGDNKPDMNQIQENCSPSLDPANVQNPLPVLPIPLPPIPDAPIPIPDVPAMPPEKLEEIQPLMLKSIRQAIRSERRQYPSKQLKSVTRTFLEGKP